ncbi:hypothetical protein IPG36_08190 [bacterium]|nr:MAG: hypothetical protein IPG36_08190 [bacterium]
MAARKPQIIDMRPQSRPHVLPPAPTPPTLTPPARVTKLPNRRTIRLILALTLLPAALALTASQIMIGQTIVIIFGLAILLTRRSATYLFGAAGLMLLAVLILQLTGHPGPAANATIYIYELLVLGVIALLLEEGVS